MLAANARTGAKVIRVDIEVPSSESQPNYHEKIVDMHLLGVHNELADLRKRLSYTDTRGPGVGGGWDWVKKNLPSLVKKTKDAATAAKEEKEHKADPKDTSHHSAVPDPRALHDLEEYAKKMDKYADRLTQLLDVVIQLMAALSAPPDKNDSTDSNETAPSESRVSSGVYYVMRN